MSETLEERITYLFECFALAYNYTLDVDEDGEYVSESTQKAYVAWRDGYLEGNGQ